MSQVTTGYTDPAVQESGVLMAPPLAEKPAPPIAFRRKKRKTMTPGQMWRTTLFIVVEIIVGLALWHVLVLVTGVSPNILPGPIPVLQTLGALIQTGAIFSATWVTLQETLLGFAIGALAGMIVAVVLDHSKLINKITNPYIVAFQAIPKIAVAPMFLIWFGFGIWSKVILISTLVFFPVLVNMLTGLRATSSDQDELMTVNHASAWHRLRHLKFYTALPYLLAAFEVCLTLAPTAAVFAEMLGSGTTIGLGTLIQLYTSRINMAGLFAIVVILSVLGILLNGVVVLARKILVRWDSSAGR